jgi:hypothetical protein
MPLPALKVVVGLVAITAVALASLPLALFALQGLRGGLALVTEASGDSVVFKLEYNGSVTLKDVRLRIVLIGPDNASLGSYYNSTAKLERGGSLSVSVPRPAAEAAREARVFLDAEVGGIYGFHLKATVPRGGGKP